MSSRTGRSALPEHIINTPRSQSSTSQSPVDSSEVPPSNKQPKKPINTRRSHKKSRNGCVQCKIKKIKCDETLPACTKCVSKGLRCPYLDYSPRQLELIRLAHWEAEGSDPSKNPYKGQSYNPNKQVDVQGGKYDLDSPKDRLFLSPSPVNQLNMQHVVQELLSSSDYGSFNLPLVKHSLNEPQLDPSKYPHYFNETFNNFTLRAFVRKDIFKQFTYAMSKPMAFNRMLIMGYGPFLSKHTHLKKQFLRLRGTSIQFLLKELMDINDNNVIFLLGHATSLDASSVFMKDEVDYKQHFKLSNGPTSIIQKVYESPSDFPKSFPVLKLYADAMLNTTKYIWVPQYNHEVFHEFLDIVEQFGTEYGKTEVFAANISEHYDNLIDFIHFSIDLLEHGKQSVNQLSKYPVEKLFELYQRWFSTVPSGCLALDFITGLSVIEKVFYSLWFTLLKLLESVLAYSKYIFSYFLDGFYLIHTFNRKDIDKYLDEAGDDQLKWYFNYCCRVIAFFERRNAIIASNKVFQEHVPIFLNLKDRLNARPLDIHEIYITRFSDTTIKEYHYPFDSSRLSRYQSTDELLDHYMTSEHSGINGGLLESIHGLKNIRIGDKAETRNDQELDLLHGINKETSLSFLDYDPRFTDPVFTKPAPFQQTSKEFIKKYIADRKLIVESIDNVDSSPGYDDEEEDEDDLP